MVKSPQSGSSLPLRPGSLSTILYQLFKIITILHNFNIKTKLIITLTISYQFQALIQQIDTEFYCGSRGMVFNYF